MPYEIIILIILFVVIIYTVLLVLLVHGALTADSKFRKYQLLLLAVGAGFIFVGTVCIGLMFVWYPSMNTYFTSIWGHVVLPFERSFTYISGGLCLYLALLFPDWLQYRLGVPRSIT